MFDNLEYVPLFHENIADKYEQITREMIEGCIDDELDEMYDPWIPNKNDKTVINIPASKCFKTFQPRLYEELVMNYCERNRIKIIVDRSSGKKVYLEPKEDI